MKKMDYMKSNELIADFLGYETIGPGFPIGYWIDGEIIDFDALKYHNDWNQLMPVVEKLRKMKHEQGWGYHNYICASLINVDIENTYKGVVEYIKFHNENQKESKDKDQET